MTFRGKWMDERPTHGIFRMYGNKLTCTCGTVIELGAKDVGLSQRVKYDLLLDRHAVHKIRREKGD